MIATIETVLLNYLQLTLIVLSRLISKTPLKAEGNVDDAPYPYMAVAAKDALDSHSPRLSGPPLFAAYDRCTSAQSEILLVL